VIDRHRGARMDAGARATQEDECSEQVKRRPKAICVGELLNCRGTSVRESITPIPDYYWPMRSTGIVPCSP
jgi:hypothetical protein